MGKLSATYEQRVFNDRMLFLSKFSSHDKRNRTAKPFDRVIVAITRYENIISRGNDHDTAYRRNEDRVCTLPRQCSSVGYRRLLPTFSLSSATFSTPFDPRPRPTPRPISCNIRSLRVKRDTARAVRSISRYNVATANTR